MGKAKKRNTARKTTGNHPFPPKDRTKQTAEKSTGAPAPHTILSSKSSKAGEVPMEVDPKEDSPAADTNEGATAPADMGEEPGDQELGTILPGTGAILTGTNEWCCKCQNGGTVHMCSYCPRVICDRCIVWPTDTPKGAPFHCLYCHNYDRQTGMRKGPSPYLGLETSSTPLVLKGSMTTRRTFSPLDSSPLFIVSFRLEALPEIGNPPIVTLHDLYQWFPEGNIEYVDIPFNLDDKGGQALFERRIERFVKKYKSKFKHFKRFIVYLSTHSEPGAGWLHSEGNNKNSTSVKNLLEILLPDEFREVLEASNKDSNIFVLLACGATVTKPGSLRELRDFALEKYFRWNIGFTQPDLQPCKLNRFLANISSEWFLHNKRPITTLRDYVSVGVHTDICMIEPDGQMVQFFWSHPGLKPLGNPLPIQCGECYSLLPWILVESKIEKGELADVTVQCGYCKEIHSFSRASQGKISRVGARGQHEATDRGEWFYKHVDTSSLST